MLPKKKTLGLVHIPKKIHLFQSLKKTLLKKGEELPHSPFLIKKSSFDFDFSKKPLSPFS
jgi:hypothetical protein